MEVMTDFGAARVRLHPAADPRGTLVLGHGAGGGIDAPDLAVSAEVAGSLGFTVALVEQPYRVAGRRAPAPAAQLDRAWLTVLQALEPVAPLIVGGRSSGARVACRTACEGGAAGVLCLAFPLHPPGRPEKTRLPELDAVSVPVLIVQGEKDPFGMPPAQAGPPERIVKVVPGSHSLRNKGAIRAAVEPWLTVVR
jgi:predicted alpha/beta-hydrolase family hydrolase